MKGGGLKVMLLEGTVVMETARGELRENGGGCSHKWSANKRRKRQAKVSSHGNSQIDGPDHGQ